MFRRVFAAAYLVLLALYWAPLFVTSLLPGRDLPFHLTVADMLSKAGSAASPYAAYYEPTLSVAPYRLYYVVVVALGRVTGLLVAHKILVAAYIAALPLATAALLRALGRPVIAALLAFPIAYNLALHHGFVSFALSLPLLMAALALVARLLCDEGPVAPRVLAASALVFSLWLLHLTIFFVAAFAAAALAVSGGLALRRRLTAVVVFVPALVAQAIWAAGPSGVSGVVPAVRAGEPSLLTALLQARRLELGARGLAGDLGDRVGLLPLHVLRGFTDDVDVWAARGVFLLLLAGVVFGVIVEMRGATGAPARLRAGCAVALVATGIAYFALPQDVPALALSMVYPCVSVVLALFALTLVPSMLVTVRGWGGVFVVAAPFALAATYGVVLTQRYGRFNDEVADFVAVSRAVPAGGRAVSLPFDRDSRVLRVDAALLGLGHTYPLLRPAPGSMVPLMNCGLPRVPCRPRAAARTLPDPGPWLPGRFSPSRALGTFDYVLVRSAPSRPLFGDVEDQVELIAEQGSWQAYRRRSAMAVLRPRENETRERVHVRVRAHLRGPRDSVWAGLDAGP